MWPGAAARFRDIVLNLISRPDMPHRPDTQVAVGACC
jgi:hypothetical protein